MFIEFFIISIAQTPGIHNAIKTINSIVSEGIITPVYAK
jgi:hypothetical protein